MEYGIRPRGLGGGSANGAVGSGSVGPGLPDGWLESAALGAAYGNNAGLLAAWQLPSSAALLLNSLQSLQSSAAAMELAWSRPQRGEQQQQQQQRRHDEDEDDDDDGDGDDEDEDNEEVGDEEEPDEDEEDEHAERPTACEENEASVESWKDTSIPVLTSWMLNAYTTMLGRLSAATAALEAVEGSHLASDSDSKSDRSSSTGILSRESSPSSSVRQTFGTSSSSDRREGRVARTTKKRRTSDCRAKSRGRKDLAGKGSSDAGTSDACPANSQGGKKRSLALQRVRYRYEREEYRCSLCSYACTIEKAFQRHLRAHARGTATETRLSCAVCGADRSSELDLSRHMRRHRDNRYFCCDICIFRTVQLKKLIQHRRMHTGEKPHLCPHCAYRSARRDNLRSHVRRVHKKENLYCDTFSPRGMFIAPKLQQPRPPEELQSEQPEEELLEKRCPPPLPVDDEDEDEDDDDDDDDDADDAKDGGNDDNDDVDPVAAHEDLD